MTMQNTVNHGGVVVGQIVVEQAITVGDDAGVVASKASDLWCVKGRVAVKGRPLVRRNHCDQGCLEGITFLGVRVQQGHRLRLCGCGSFQKGFVSAITQPSEAIGERARKAAVALRYGLILQRSHQSAL